MGKTKITNEQMYYIRIAIIIILILMSLWIGRQSAIITCAESFQEYKEELNKHCMCLEPVDNTPDYSIVDRELIDLDVLETII